MQTRASPSMSQLHRMARQASIEGFDSMSKSVLYDRLQEQYDFERLRRVENRRTNANGRENKKRKAMEGEEAENENAPSQKKVYGSSSSSSNSSSGSSSSSSSSSGCASRSNKGSSSSSSASGSSSSIRRPKREELNAYDPIMLTPIAKKALTFKFMRPNGTSIRFVVETLVDYLLCSGDFSDPETRLKFSDEDLLQIDLLAKAAGMNKASVVEAKKNTKYYADKKFHADAMQGLERCAGEVVAEILNVVETYDPDDAQMQLVMREFPAFLDYYKQLNDVEPAYAAKCLVQWMLFVQGPPNRPNRDDYGLIEIVGNFFKCVAESLI